MVCLIVGGAGFIGSHTLLALARSKKYSKLVVFDSLENGHKEAVDIVRENTGAEIDLVQGNLLNKDDLRNLFSKYKFDAVIHFAAYLEAGLSMEEPTRFFENNISGTINLVKEMQKNNVRRIVFSSTAATFGTPKQELVDETFEVNPENWYGYTKLVIENFLESLTGEHVHEEEKINSVVLRYFNAAGADPEGLLGQDYPRPTQLIAVAVQVALGKREKLTVFGGDYPTKDGTCVRDYIHVSDLADAHVKALGYLDDFKGKELINLGTGKGTSNLEIIKALENVHGKFKWEIGPRRPGDPAAYYTSNAKAKKLLGWEPKYNVEDIVKHAYEWAKKNPNGYATN